MGLAAHTLSLRDGRPVITTARGTPLLSFGPLVECALRADPAAEAVHVDAAHLAWTHASDSHAVDRDIRGRATGAHGTWDVSVARRRAGGAFELAIEHAHHVDGWCAHESLSIAIGTRVDVCVLDRAFRFVRPASGMVIDAWTPKLIALDVDDERAWLDINAASIAIERAAHGWTVRIELDHEDNHPFRAYPRVWERYDAEHEQLRVRRDACARTVGSVVRARAAITSGALALAKLRFAHGRRAALCMTDHADQSDERKLRAFAFGSSRAEPARDTTARAGFAGHGLRMTKSVFHLDAPGYAPQLASTRYLELARDLHRRGFEICPHTTCGVSAVPASLRDSLELFAREFGAVTWIDHQPSTKADALCNRGVPPETTRALLGLLGEFGYRFAWSGIDAALAAADANLFRPERHTERCPVLYQHSATGGAGPNGLYLFTTKWCGLPWAEIVRLLGAATLDALERERGLLIAHTYLDTCRAQGWVSGWSLLVAEPDGHYRLREEADRAFAGLRERVDRGTLHVAGIREIAAHLVAMDALELEWLEPGVFELCNRSSHPLEGAAFLVPACERGPRVEPRIDGAPLDATRVRHAADGSSFWLDLAPGARHVIECADAAERARLARSPNSHATSRSSSTDDHRT